MFGPNNAINTDSEKRTMSKVTARPHETKVSFSKGSEVVRVEYGLGELQATVHDPDTKTDFVVGFSDVIAFRVLDERDMMDYWPVCSMPNGWLFEINSNGWLAYESNCLIVAMHPKAKEYLVTGEDDCLNVISLKAPRVSEGAL